MVAPATGGHTPNRKVMGKLFLKLWILMLLTSLGSLKLQQAVFENYYREDMASSSNERFRRIFSYVEAILQPVPQASWVAHVKELQPQIGPTKMVGGAARLTTVSELAGTPGFDAEAIARVRSPNPLIRGVPGGVEAYRTILGTEVVAVVVAPGVKDAPLFGLLTPTQFTWMVESSMYALAVGLWLTLFWGDMKKLVGAAGQVGEGQFDVDVKVRKGTALRPLADAFNLMKERVAALLGSHRNLTNAISHEFRTPITRLRFRHQMAMDATDVAEKDKQLRAMDSAIDQLDELSTELLEYARMDRESPKLDVAPIDTSAWLEELAAEARELSQAEGRDINITVQASVESVDGDYRYLSRAASNLLRNAVRYARREVQVQVGRQDGAATLHVDDDGPGIPVAEREHLFEPFARLDKSRDRQSGGFGMGLAIVRQIARWHGGSATISESRLGGARVSLSW